MGTSVTSHSELEDRGSLVKATTVFFNTRLNLDLDCGISPFAERGRGVGCREEEKEK